MSVRSAQARFRRSERALMDTQGVLVRDSAEPTYDPDTGEYAQPTVVVYEGPVLLRAAQWEGAATEIGETQIVRRSTRIKFPADTPVLRDDRFTVTASPGDARMVGRTYRVTDVVVDEWQVSGQTFAEEIA